MRKALNKAKFSYFCKFHARSKLYNQTKISKLIIKNVRNLIQPTLLFLSEPHFHNKSISHVFFDDNYLI